jgi:hypothetical protein
MHWGSAGGTVIQMTPTLALLGLGWPPDPLIMYHLELPRRVQGNHSPAGGV